MINKQINCDKLNLDPDILTKAWHGDAIAQLKLGKAFFTKNDYVNAFDLLLLSAEQGNMEAQFILADLYALGQGTQTSQENAYRWYTKAALQGYKKALIRIHNLYQQDKRMYCRGQLDSSEKIWTDEEFKKKNNIRELNEYRREQHGPILNNVVDYYTNKFRYYKSSHQENTEFDLNLGFLYQHGYGTKKNILLAFEFYNKAAKKGHRDAQYGLAYLYQNNSHIKFNYRLALRWYRSSAANGNVAAQNCLGNFYEKGLGTELNLEGALYWYTKAANAENSNAQLTLGRLYRKGQGVTQSLSEATKWYRLAANQGNSAAQNCLNQLYLSEKIPSASNNKDVVPQLPATFTLRSKLQSDIVNLRNPACITKLKLLAQHALMTDGNAMYQIGLKYYNGEEFSQDKDAGFQWLKKAAETGLEVAQFKIAEMYKDGEEVDQDYHKSSIWTIKTVKKRSNTSMLKLGILYKNGFGVRRDPLEASKWFLKSAEGGNTHAQFQFGLLKYYGDGVRKDKGEASIFLLKSALLGNTNALYRFGQMYENDDFAGKDIPKKIRIFISALTEKNDKATATFKIYQAAASLGGEDAQFRLANIYEEGKLVKQDLEKAYEYYIKAANSNNPFYQVELALKYINGVIEDRDYIRTFDLFKKAAEKGEPRATCIFQTPIQCTSTINDYSKVLDMFILAVSRGIKGLEYNIGYAYEHGIKLENKVIFQRNYTYSKYWYSLAATRCHYRAIYNANVMREHGEPIINYLGIASDNYHLVFEHGNSEISYNLGLTHQRGYHRVPQDFIKAFNLFIAASNMGHQVARKKLVLSGHSENMKMFEAVADSGNVAVQYQLGVFFEYKSDSKSIKWLSLAAEGGSSDACYRLGRRYEEGKTVSTDYAKVIALYSKAIENNHENALYRLAQIYHYGKGTDRDYLKAYDLYIRSASLGHTSAAKILDLNVKQKANSHEKMNAGSIPMFECVAKQGDADLQLKLGYYYEKCKASQSYSEAFKWYELASRNSNTEAIYRLGLLYEKGLGVKRDYNMSVQLYNQARDQGSHHALHRLGVAFQYGHGIEKNLTEAVNSYTKAAKLGNHESQYALGRLYETAEFVQRDILKALVLYTDAYKNGNTDVLSNLYDLYDDQPYEHFFNQKLFQILSQLEKEEKMDIDKYQTMYGHMYYRLGKMYLEGVGTEKYPVRALENFLKAKDKYGNSNAKPFTALVYDEYKDKKEDYTQRMKAYFQIKDRNNIGSELQYRIGMLLYKEGKCYCKEHEKEKNDTTLPETALKKYCTAFQYLSLASKNNHKKAQYQLSLMYFFGHGVQQNEHIAVEWIEKSIDAMEPHLCYRLGMDFYYGKGVNQNYKIASVYIKNAAEKDQLDAKIQLTIMYLHGYGVEKNEERANNWIQRSIKNMDEYGCYKQGMKFYRGDNVDRNYDIALTYFNEAAEKNYTGAMTQLAVMYLHGRGVKQNEEEANKWIQQSIEGLDEYGCYKQGMEFYKGDNVVRNYDFAFTYLKGAAEKNYDDAMAQLAIMYLLGFGVEKNEEEANKWIQQSIEGLDAYDCYNQGMKFYKGYNFNRNYNIALTYFKGAAEKNYAGAMTQLAIMYLLGFGVEKNGREANKWIQKSIEIMNEHRCYKQGMKFYKGGDFDINYHIALAYFKGAAEKNNSDAMAQLAVMYLHGHGVEQNEERANQLIRKSIEMMSGYSCYDHGMKFYKGDDVDINYYIAMTYFEGAAQKDNGDAMAQLAIMYLHGYGVKQSSKEANIWVQRSIKKMDGYSCYNQGIKFYRGDNVDRNYDIALIYFNEAAEEHNGDAMAQLAVMYLHGYSVEKNAERVNKWIQRSIKRMEGYSCYEQGMKFYKGNDTDINYNIALAYFNGAAQKDNGDAMAQLAIMYLHGYGVKQSSKEANIWVQRSIKKMDGYSCYNQGIKFYEGNDVNKSYKIALTYFQGAAKKNYGGAMAQLAVMYLHGYSVEKNEERANQLIRKSIKRMEGYSCYEQGMKFYKGNDTDINYNIALIYFKGAAQKDNGDAMAQLAIMYLHGYGVKQSSKEANIWIQQSIKKMDGYSCYNHGMKFYEGKDVDTNHKIALTYFKGAAEKNNSDAMAQLAVMYLHGYSVEKNAERVNKWIQRSIKRMDGYSCYEQGMKFYKGNDTDINYNIALTYFNGAAEKGNSDAMAQLAIMYLYGYGVKKNEEKANKWIRRSIKKMDGYSCYLQGIKFYEGSDVNKNYNVAWTYFKGAAEKKNFDAMAQLAIMCFYGHGVKQDEERAIECIQQSIKRMDVCGCYNQGIKFYEGNGVDRNYDIAIIYLKDAADKGFAYSQAQLGHIYLHGHGVDRDHDAANQWYNKVLDDYPSCSAFIIGQIYHFDRDGMQNFSKAFEWYLRESNRGDTGYSLHGIGLLYEYGDGVGQDYQKAFEYYQRAVRIGKIGGYYNLALLYYHGRGVKQSYDKVFAFFTKVIDSKPFSEEMYVLIENINLDSKSNKVEATNRKYSLVSSQRIRGEAYHYIGLLYENGKGRVQDKQKARYHFKKAFEHGVERSLCFLK